VKFYNQSRDHFVLFADFYSGAGSAPLLVTGSQYDDVMLFGHVPRPTPPPWAPVYAAAAAAAATYYRYGAASLPSPCSPSIFAPQFSPAGGYLGVTDPLSSVGGYCGSRDVQGDDVSRCLKSLRCDFNNLLPLRSTTTATWQRSTRGNHCHCLYVSNMYIIIHQKGKKTEKINRKMYTYKKT